MKHLFICEMSWGSYFVYNMIVVKVLFCLMTHLTHFYLRLYGVGHMVKDHSDSERGNPLPTLHGLLFFISSKGSFICIIPPVLHDWCNKAHGMFILSVGWCM